MDMSSKQDSSIAPIWIQNLSQ